MKNIKPKHILSITDLTAGQIHEVLSLASQLKLQYKDSGSNPQFLKDKTLVMIFEKPSLRTRLSFEIGISQLGGHAVYLGPTDIGLGIRESIRDVAKVVSSMGDIMMARTFKHETIIQLAHHASVPIINGLSDLEHPCQILADVLTILEVKGNLKGRKLVFVGDGENNVTHSLALASGLLGIHFTVVAPKGYFMNPAIAKMASRLAQNTRGSILEETNPRVAIKGADVVYTDTWVSMGDEEEKESRLKIFQPYQVTRKLMKLAKKDAIFMHDLPAYRGNEVESAVIDGPQSVVFSQAENRLHAQKALMVYLQQR